MKRTKSRDGFTDFEIYSTFLPILVINKIIISIVRTGELEIEENKNKINEYDHLRDVQQNYLITTPNDIKNLIFRKEKNNIESKIMRNFFSSYKTIHQI